MSQKLHLLRTMADLLKCVLDTSKQFKGRNIYLHMYFHSIKNSFFTLYFRDLTQISFTPYILIYRFF